MREAQILAMRAAQAKRDGVVLAQLEWLKTRQEAFERVAVNAKWRERLLWLFKPAGMLKAVEAVQHLLLEESKKALDEAATRSKLKAGVPSIQVVPR